MLWTAIQNAANENKMLLVSQMFEKVVLLVYFKCIGKVSLFRIVSLFFMCWNLYSNADAWQMAMILMTTLCHRLM